VAAEDEGFMSCCYQMGQRRQVQTNDDSRFHAFVRSAAEGSEHILVVANFWAISQNIRIDTGGLRAETLTDLRKGRKYRSLSSASCLFSAIDYS
jgi:hypothetical protein